MSKDTDKALDVIGQKLRLKEEIAAPVKEEKKRFTLFGGNKKEDTKKEKAKKSSPKRSAGTARLSVRRTRR